MGIALVLSVVLRTLVLVLVTFMPIRVTTTDGKTIEGEFAGMGDAKLLVDVDGEVQTIAWEDLQSILAIEQDDDATGPTNRVTLTGGSQIAAQDMTLSNESLTIEPRRQAKIVVPLKQVKAIRFRAASPAIDAQWLGLLEQDARADLLAIRRANDQLDRAPGMLESIADDVVEFNMDGDAILAPMNRLEGVVLNNKLRDSKSTVQVVDHYGSRFAAETILPSSPNQPLKLKLSDSVTHQLPLKHLQSIFFSGGIEMLATQKAAKVGFDAYVQTNLDPARQSTWFSPAADGEDLIVNGGGSIEFRVDEGFTHLAGSVRREMSVDKAGEVTVEIFVDEKPVWKESITDTQPKGFDLPIKKARRIKLVARCGDDGDLGDKVRIMRPRLLK